MDGSPCKRGKARRRDTPLCHFKLTIWQPSLIQVSSPVLVIHGTEDDVIDFSHGLAIYEKCPRAVEPLWVEVRRERLRFFAKPKLQLETMMVTLG